MERTRAPHHNAPMSDAPPAHPVTGLLLTGGGARAAYQIGVLEAHVEETATRVRTHFEALVGKAG